MKGWVDDKHMLKIDMTTSIHSRGRFARIFMEINLARKLIPKISVFGSELKIKYEEVPIKKPANNEEGSVVEANAESSNQTLVDHDPKEGKNKEFGILSCDNQGCANFRPWMMVKQPSRRKKSSYQGKSTKINSHDSEEKQERFYEGDNHANSNGSRFNTLHEEGRESTSEDHMHEETGTDSNVADGLVPPKAQKNLTKSHSIQKAILKVGASKNP
ncbi:hypothetical protein AHAS_Ahas09G0081400 [Arachis hypogaea]